ncbi:MAG: DUF1801 domain-containing protein [Armatimonadetes bacterium]|nr:DUF1801 domain-containing protein [Armatimonadota bacterium]
MSLDDQIEAYLAGHPEPKRSELRELDGAFREIVPGGATRFFDGKDDDGKVVSNPTVGYGTYTLRYADGSSKESFQTGLAANATGISVDILGLKDKSALFQRFGATIGKADVTGYCIRFRSLKNIDVEVLKAAVRYGAEAVANGESADQTPALHRSGGDVRGTRLSGRLTSPRRT